MAITLKQRVYAGLWFMAAGIIPVLYISSLLLPLPSSVGTLEFILWLMAAPLLVAGISGALFGAGILDSRRVSKGWQAALRGLLVALITFLSSSVLMAVWETSTNEYASFARTLILTLGLGLMVTGWLVAIVGALAGWLLYQWRMSKQARLQR